MTAPEHDARAPAPRPRGEVGREAAPRVRPIEVLDVAGDVVPPWVRKLVFAMDDLVRIPGTDRGVGLDALLGFVFPGAGDALTGLTSLVLLVVAARRGVPGVVLARMVLQQFADVVVGAVPFLGDVFDVFFRANRRNLELIELHADGKREPTLGDKVVVALALLVGASLVVLPLVLGAWLVTSLVRWTQG